MQTFPYKVADVASVGGRRIHEKENLFKRTRERVRIMRFRRFEDKCAYLI